MSNDNQGWVIVKVGGSILTRTDGSVNLSVLEAIGRDLAVHTGPAVVVHGTGRVGRVVLERHRVTSDQLPDSRSEVVLEFRRAVRDLSSTVFRALESVGLRCFHIVPHEHFRACSGRLVDDTPRGEVARLLGSATVTVLHGDAVEDTNFGYYFCSGDEIVAILAAQLRPVCVVFLTDVDGVYYPFPPGEGDLPLAEVDRSFADHMRGEYVVGQADMVGKVRQAVLAAEHSKGCYIANGTRKGLLSRLLSGTVADGDRFTRIIESALPSGVSHE